MATTKTSKVLDDHLELVRRFPLVRIKNDRHLERAHAVIDDLSIEGENGLTSGELDYLLALGDLTTVYERDAIDEMTRPVGLLGIANSMSAVEPPAAKLFGRV